MRTQITISVTTRPGLRGNASGYTRLDYARDAAAAINTRLMETGYSSHLSEDRAGIESGICFAEREIEGCDESFRDLLLVEQEESPVEDDE
ncbi:MAG: hypothetical protein ACTHMO_12490 [Rhodanobacteraceae bacterium]